jgi:hypothetical protein
MALIGGAIRMKHVPFLPVVSLLALGSLMAGCKGQVSVPGKERVGTFELYSVGPPLMNDCEPAIIAFGPDGGLLDGGQTIDGGIVLSVTYNNETSIDGGSLLPDGGKIQKYDAGFLTFVDGSGSEWGVIEGQVFDVAASSPRVFPQCTCVSISPPDILVEERNVLAVFSPSQAALLNPPRSCPPPDVVLDGGIPAGGTPARDVNGVWSVGLVCGFTEDHVAVLGTNCTSPDGGTCSSCTVRFSVQGVPSQ